MIEVLVESWPILVALVGLLGLSAFFSSSETAVFSLVPGSLSDMARSRPRTAEKLELLLAGRRRLLVTILLGNLLVNLAYFNLGGLMAVRLAEREPWMAWVAPILILCGILVAGEIVPKMVAVRWPTAIAGLTCWPLSALEVALAVPRTILSAIAEAIGRLMLGNEPEEGEISPEELGELLNAAAREGALARDEHVQLQAMLEFDRARIKEVMSPRVEVAALPLGSEREAVLALARERGRSKIILFDPDLDHARHWVDALELLGEPNAQPLDHLQPLTFVPETARVMDMLERFRSERIHIAIAVDEYGGTEGVVTREDLVEAVVGDLADEVDAHPPEAVSDNAGGWLVTARLGLKAFGRLVGSTADELGVETVGGLVTALLGRLPRVGDRVRSGGIEFLVVEVTGQRPTRIRVSPAPHEAQRGTRS